MVIDPYRDDQVMHPLKMDIVEHVEYSIWAMHNSWLNML